MRITIVPTIVVFVILLLSGCTKSYKNVVSYSSTGYSQQKKYAEENFTSDEECAVKDKRYPAFQFDNGDDYVVDGMYRIVDEQSRIGYANEKGNTVISPRFKFGLPFENGKARVTDEGIKIQDGEHWYWDSNDWYFIDKTGRKIL